MPPAGSGSLGRWLVERPSKHSLGGEVSARGGNPTYSGRSLQSPDNLLPFAARCGWPRQIRIDCPAVDPFALVLIGGLVALIIWVALLGKYAPGSGLEQLGLKSAREISERRAELDAEDLDQMLEAHNKRRVARGEASLSSSDLEMQVMSEINAQRRRDQQEMAARREQSVADRELDQLLEATNARRRARGLPDRTRDEVRREFGGS